jgi:amidase
VRDPYGAFLSPGGDFPPAADEGPLAGLDFAVKDNYAIAGWRTRAGSPTWERTHSKEPTHAEVVGRLMAAGARLVGRTVMDELAYGIEGKNLHDGSPRNPVAPDHLCGGSSCGSAASVAGGLVDFALGTDTAGSIRVPASWTGLFGLRPTHGRLSLRGVVPLSPPFDTVGWLARSAGVLARVGEALFEGDVADPPSSMVVAHDVFDCVAPESRPCFDSALERASSQFASVREAEIPEATLDRWRIALAALQRRGIGEALGPWLVDERPDLAPYMAERFEAALVVSDDEVADARRVQAEARESLGALLAEAVLCLPATPCVAPRRDSSDDEHAAVRVATMRLQAPACLGGLPQLVVPAALPGEMPIGLSFVAATAGDLGLLALAERL